MPTNKKPASSKDDADFIEDDADFIEDAPARDTRFLTDEEEAVWQAAHPDKKLPKDAGSQGKFTPAVPEYTPTESFALGAGGALIKPVAAVAKSLVTPGLTYGPARKEVGRAYDASKEQNMATHGAGALTGSTIKNTLLGPLGGVTLGALEGYAGSESDDPGQQVMDTSAGVGQALAALGLVGGLKRAASTGLAARGRIKNFMKEGDTALSNILNKPIGGKPTTPTAPQAAPSIPELAAQNASKAAPQPKLANPADVRMIQAEPPPLPQAAAESSAAKAVSQSRRGIGTYTQGGREYRYHRDVTSPKAEAGFSRVRAALSKGKAEGASEHIEQQKTNPDYNKAVRNGN